MLTDEQIQNALHASRVVPLEIENPHGPFGLEQVAAMVERLQANSNNLVSRPVTLHAATWEKLDDLARETSKEMSQPITANDVASALLERFVKGNERKTA